MRRRALQLAAGDTGNGLYAAHATEHEHQAALFRWAAQMSRAHPHLALLYAIPNAGKRSVGAARYMVAEGLRAGVPDVCLPVPSGPYAACYIEMKAAAGKPTVAQLDWLQRLREAGNYATVCYGWDAARSVLLAYLEHRWAALPGGRA